MDFRRTSDFAIVRVINGTTIIKTPTNRHPSRNKLRRHYQIDWCMETGETTLFEAAALQLSSTGLDVLFTCDVRWQV